MKVRAPVGGISSVALFIISVYLDIWSKLNVVGTSMLSAALVILFLWDYAAYEVERE
jgi:hypothetical protein